jgi:hypothetical protein
MCVLGPYLVVSLVGGPIRDSAGSALYQADCPAFRSENQEMRVECFPLANLLSFGFRSN